MRGVWGVPFIPVARHHKAPDVPRNHVLPALFNVGLQTKAFISIYHLAMCANLGS